MTIESNNLTAKPRPRSFVLRLAIFYAAVFGLVGTHLPFFPVWLKAVGIDASWIGAIVAVPSITRFTILPLVTSLTERFHFLRGAMIVTAFATATGFAAIGTLSQPLAVLIVYALTAGLWTPMTPLADAYALKAVASYGLNYGPLRLWGSAAFVVGALCCGLLLQAIDARHLIWIIVATAAFGAAASLALLPIDARKAQPAASFRAVSLLRDRGFLAIIVSSALIQGSHAAYYTFASIAWQRDGLDGLHIAGLWVLGVLAEIVLFAISPRIRLSPVVQIVVAACCAALRWIVTAQSPPLAVLAVAQTIHGISFGLTLVATMTLLLRHVPAQVMGSAQGYLAAATGIVMSSTAIVSGSIYDAIGQGIYYLMAAMALTGAGVIWAGRRRAGAPASIAAQPHSAASGG